MKSYLINDILPFWIEHAIDKELGGIFTLLDREGNLYGTDKSVWFQGRALYIFSLTYNRIEKNPEYLKAAKIIFDFLPKCTDETGRMPYTVTREGITYLQRRHYFSETFAAIGCAEYYFATGDEEAKRRAEMYFDVAYSLFTGERKSPPPKFNPDAAPYKGLAPAMILLSTAQVLRRINKEKYDTAAKNCIKNILPHWTKHGLLENISKENEFVDTPTGRVVNPGHSLECAWFLMAEGIYNNDAVLMNLGRDIIDKSMELGMQNGGIVSFTDCLGKPSLIVDCDVKRWWPQNEAIIANRLCYEIFGQQKYLDNCNSLLDFVFEHFADKEYGEWFGYLHYDNTPSQTLKGNITKGPFHIPRMLIMLELMDKKEPILL